MSVIGTHYITVDRETGRQIMDAQRLADRRHNAIDVLEEATAEMARQSQFRARYLHIQTTPQMALNDDDRIYWQKQSAEASRLARRYLFALVGDGRPEE